MPLCNYILPSHGCMFPGKGINQSLKLFLDTVHAVFMRLVQLLVVLKIIKGLF